MRRGIVMNGNGPIELVAARRRQIVAAAAAVSLTGAFFIAPLCAALMLCSMPCCDAGETVGLVAADASPCSSECAVRADEARPSGVEAVTPYTVVAGGAPLTAESVHRPPLSSIRGAIHDGSAAHRASDAPLHVLNSVFRI